MKGKVYIDRKSDKGYRCINTGILVGNEDHNIQWKRIMGQRSGNQIVSKLTDGSIPNCLPIPSLIPNNDRTAREYMIIINYKYYPCKMCPSLYSHDSMVILAISKTKSDMSN